MEKLTDSNQEVQQIAETAIFHLSIANPIELACALLLPALALILGIWFDRWTDRRENKTLHAKFFDFIGPLMGPTLAVIFLMAAGYTLRAMGYERYLIPFVWKVFVAWTAIKLVAMTSSRQSTGWIIVLVIIPITLLHLFGLWDPVTKTLSDVKFAIGSAELNAWGIIKSVAAVIIMFWVASFIVNATDARLRKVRRIHVSNRMLIMKFFQIVLYFIVFLIGLQVLGVDLTAFSVVGGAVGVGVGFGLQKIASNFMSGIILLFEKTVSIDDLIELSDGTSGYIRQTAARYTMIETTNGRKIFIPNEEFITQRVTTLTYGARRGQIEMPLLLHFDTDIAHACKLMVQAAHAHPNVMDDPAPGAFVIGCADNGLQARLLFWVKDITAGTYGVRTAILTEMMRLFKQNGVIIAYPHQVAASDRWGVNINTDTDSIPVPTALAEKEQPTKVPARKAAKEKPET